VLSDEAEAGIFPSSPKLVRLVKLLEPLVAQRPRGAKLCVLLADASPGRLRGQRVSLRTRRTTSAAFDVELMAPAKKLELFEWHTVTLAVATDPYVPILWPQFHIAVLYSPSVSAARLLRCLRSRNVIVLDSAADTTARIDTRTLVRNLHSRVTGDSLIVDVKSLMSTPIAELVAVEAPPPEQAQKKARVESSADIENVVPQQRVSLAVSMPPPTAAAAGVATQPPRRERARQQARSVPDGAQSTTLRSASWCNERCSSGSSASGDAATLPPAGAHRGAIADIRGVLLLAVGACAHKHADSTHAVDQAWSNDSRQPSSRCIAATDVVVDRDNVCATAATTTTTTTTTTTINTTSFTTITIERRCHEWRLFERWRSTA
jgi:hypothetical protein